VRSLGPVCLLAAALASRSNASADDSPRVVAAFDLCRQADAVPADDKLAQLALLNRGAQLAEAAIEEHPDDVRAHLALCCTFGKAIEAAGLSWRSLQRLARLKAVVATAVALAPDDPDVLVAEGEILRRVPALLGGDPAEAEQLFRRALAKNPEQLTARLGLAHVLAARGDPEAPAAVALALSQAQLSGTPRELADAWALFARPGRR
jgi:predicted Zn-dependent protease